jgi:hypothetical protein
MTDNKKIGIIAIGSNLDTIAPNLLRETDKDLQKCKINIDVDLPMSGQEKRRNRRRNKPSNT